MISISRETLFQGSCLLSLYHKKYSPSVYAFIHFIPIFLFLHGLFRSYSAQCLTIHSFVIVSEIQLHKISIHHFFMCILWVTFPLLCLELISSPKQYSPYISHIHISSLLSNTLYLMPFLLSFSQSISALFFPCTNIIHPTEHT